MVQVQEMSYKEKVEMYNLIDKKGLIDMLIEANKCLQMLEQKVKIDFIDSSLQLKEKYKKVTFNEWLELMGYYKKKDKWYNKHGYLRSYQRLIVKYESFTSDL